MAHDYEVVAFCVDAYLRYVRSLTAAMDDIADEIAEAESRLHLLGVSYEGRQAACPPAADKLPEGVLKLMELRGRLADEVAADLADVERARALCRENHERRALWMQKVDGMTYAQIAQEMRVSFATARRLVERGKWSLYYSMPEEWRRYSVPNALPE